MKKMSKPKYYYLKAGEIVQQGDEAEVSNNPFKDEPKWIPAIRIGQPAPDPNYPAHTKFRRLIK